MSPRGRTSGERVWHRGDEGGGWDLLSGQDPGSSPNSQVTVGEPGPGGARVSAFRDVWVVTLPSSKGCQGEHLR